MGINVTIIGGLPKLCQNPNCIGRHTYALVAMSSGSNNLPARGSSRLSEWQPVIVYPVSLGSVTAQEVRAKLNVGLCDHCRGRLGIEAFLTEDGWKKIKIGIMKAGKTPPLRSKVRLEWDRIDGQK